MRVSRRAEEEDISGGWVGCIREGEERRFWILYFVFCIEGEGMEQLGLYGNSGGRGTGMGIRCGTTVAM